MAKKKLTLEDMLVPMDEIPYEVPENWCWVRFEHLVKDTKLGLVRSIKQQSIDYEYNYLKMNNITNSGDIDLNGIVNVNADREEIEVYSLRKGDFLFNTRNSKELVGKNTVVKEDFQDIMLFNNNIMRVRFHEGINPQIVSSYLNSPMGQRKLDEIKRVTTNIAAIYAKDLNKILIPIPPLAEQERIVNRIESLFDKVDRAVELVDEARDGFEKRRSAILERAFSGELTKKWREENKNLKPTQVIVEEIKSELIKWYESKVKESKELGTKKPRKIKFDIEKSEKEYLFENIPRDWRISYFEELVAPIENSLKAGPFGSALKKDFYTEKGYKIYGQEQVIKGDPYYGDYYINEEKFKELSTCEVFEGDLLISLVGTIGKVLIIPSDYEKGIINPRLVKISLNKKVSTEYIAKYFESPTAKFIMSEKSHGGTMDILNLNIIKKLPIPLPPYEEQVEIVRLVNKMIEEELEVQEYTDISNYIDIIKKSILAKAFRGELGSNNLKEESSIELLKELIK